MAKHDPIPQDEVLAWLQEHHPELAAVAEVERAWVWLPVDLRGDNNKATRESIKEFGFRWAKHGHVLPSGRTGTWGHSADHPTRFKRHGKDNRNNTAKTGSELDPSLAAEIDSVLNELGV